MLSPQGTCLRDACLELLQSLQTAKVKLQGNGRCCALRLCERTEIFLHILVDLQNQDVLNQKVRELVGLMRVLDSLNKLLQEINDSISAYLEEDTLSRMARRMVVNVEFIAQKVKEWEAFHQSIHELVLFFLPQESISVFQRQVEYFGDVQVQMDAFLDELLLKFQNAHKESPSKFQLLLHELKTNCSDQLLFCELDKKVCSNQKISVKDFANLEEALGGRISAFMAAWKANIDAMLNRWEEAKVVLGKLKEGCDAAQWEKLAGLERKLASFQSISAKEINGLSALNEPKLVTLVKDLKDHLASLNLLSMDRDVQEVKNLLQKLTENPSTNDVLLVSTLLNNLDTAVTHRRKVTKEELVSLKSSLETSKAEEIGWLEWKLDALDLLSVEDHNATVTKGIKSSANYENNMNLLLIRVEQEKNPMKHLHQQYLKERADRQLLETVADARQRLIETLQANVADVEKRCSEEQAAKEKALAELRSLQNLQSRYDEIIGKSEDRSLQKAEQSRLHCEELETKLSRETELRKQKELELQDVRGKFTQLQAEFSASTAQLLASEISLKEEKLKRQRAEQLLESHIQVVSDRITRVYTFNDRTIREAVSFWCSNREEAERRYGHISLWNTSQVSSFRELFKRKTNFNDDISNWDTSNVTDMFAMFLNASNFNQPIGKWDVSEVINMHCMFNGDSSFNQPLKDWNVSNVTNMCAMFRCASSFNQPLQDWNVANVTNMCAMFRCASSFNQPLGKWKSRSCTNMGWMFDGASAFNQPINDWHVAKVTNIHAMFRKASSFNQPLQSWVVANVTDMAYAFYDASSFNQSLDNWHADSTCISKNMFSGKSSK